MGRLIAARYVVKGDLMAQTPIHIGGALEGLVTDMPLARDGADRFYIPGTSLAGPIRRWWKRRRSETEIVFGRIPMQVPDDQEPDKAKDVGHASFIIVDDAPVVGEALWELRDGVGIDRRTGSAAEGIKYDREVLPCQTAFRFHMEVDFAAGEASVVPEISKGRMLPRPDRDAMEKSLGSLLVALREGHIRFGAAKTRGLGQLVLKNVTVNKHKIGEYDGIIQYLTEDPASAPNIYDGLVAIADQGKEQAEIAIVVAWRPDLPVMNKSEAEGVSIDVLPLVTGVRDCLQPVIAGASIKGVLRAHGERICCTLAGAKPSGLAFDSGSAGKLPPKQEFLNDVTEYELIEALFGAPGKGREDDNRYEKMPDDVSIPGLGALSADDCLIDKPITRSEWRDLLMATHNTDEEEKSGVVRRLLEKPGSSWMDFRAATHVAIDRWTGGAAENLLFSRLEPAVDGAHKLELWLDLDRIAPRLADGKGDGAEGLGRFRQAAFALLIVTLRDLARGRIPIGFGTTRGLGSIRVERIAFDMTPRAAADLGLPGADRHAIEFTPADFEAGAGMDQFAVVEEAWRTYWPQERKP